MASACPYLHDGAPVDTQFASTYAGKLLNVEQAGANASMYFTNATAAHSGAQGLHLNRPSTSPSTLPVSIIWEVGGVPKTELGMDFETDDLTFYSHALLADIFRVRPDTGQWAMGPVVGQPALGGPQLQINGGTAADAKGCLGLTMQAGGSYNIQCLTAAANKRTKIVFQAQASTGFQMGTDSGTNGTDDFWLFGNALSGFVLQVDAAGVVNVGESGSVTGAVKLRSQKLAFYNGTPGTKPTITGSRGANAALTSLLSQLATLGLIVDSTS